MAKEKRESGPDPVFEFKDKDNYNFVLTQHLVILAKESAVDGLSENYVHGVFSYQNKLPSREWETNRVHKSAIHRLDVIRRHLIRKLGLPENDGIPKLEDGMTHLKLFEWALGLDPDFFKLYPEDDSDCRSCGFKRVAGKPCGNCRFDEKEVMKFYQTIVLEMIAVDLSDDMESLRSRIPKSEQGWES